MRALGPGSVSSLLKVALDVMYVVLWAVIGFLLLAALGALLLPPDSEVLARLPPSLRGPLLAGCLLAFAAYVGTGQFVLKGVRSIFSTLIAGDPFHPDNVPRLRAIGFGLVALELIRYGIRFIVSLLPSAFDWEQAGFNPTAWFAVLVVFVLAEVFREGARLRREAELTI